MAAADQWLRKAIKQTRARRDPETSNPVAKSNIATHTHTCSHTYAHIHLKRLLLLLAALNRRVIESHEVQRKLLVWDIMEEKNTLKCIILYVYIYKCKVLYTSNLYNPYFYLKKYVFMQHFYIFNLADTSVQSDLQLKWGASEGDRKTIKQIKVHFTKHTQWFYFNAIYRDSSYAHIHTVFWWPIRAGG